ncbi:site-specific integrase [Celeribacter sp. PS-C1]|uniref:tyrosine-type recombinase/integrase n=1 Tax=Celeribacter sp. PS-C1 TaxID=2820813 RepID=UPI001CA4B87D|nr:site-specific integrase [Celeribacter sp. PS-C1]MBW6419503.1 integrase arm-type DNA-binding domain-containing protein [Celeribacter sp. PS-C1]
MAKPKLSTVKELDALTHTGANDKPERYGVEGIPGLYMQITPKGSKSWLLRVSVNGKSRELGLGGYPENGLKDAKNKAKEQRAKAQLGIDAKAEKEETRAKNAAAAREVEAKSYTFEKALDDYVDIKRATFKTYKAQMQWESPVRRYALPVVGKMLVDEITVQDVLKIIQPLWDTKNETAGRVRSRMELIIASATVRGYRKGDNPARWVGNLAAVLPPAKAVHKVRNMPAIPFARAAEWFAELHQCAGMGARALEFLALTTVRSGNVRGAVWDEIDLEAGIWEIPAERMKMRQAHAVPLATAALDLLKALPRMQGNPLVFPAPRGGELSDMTLSATMRRMHAAKLEQDGIGWIDETSKAPAVPHGLRSTFRDWAGDMTEYPRELAEMVLAHTVGGVEGAYRRGQAIERRRPIMEAWAAHLTGAEQESGKVVRFG